MISKLRIFVCVLFLLFVGGCETPKDKYLKRLDYFKNNISQLLGDNDSVEVAAAELSDFSDLTGFSWDCLSFDRYEFLTLSFYSKNSKIVFELDYEDYFVDDLLTDEGILGGVCFRSQDNIIIKKRHSGVSEQIGFLPDQKLLDRIPPGWRN